MHVIRPATLRLHAYIHRIPAIHFNHSSHASPPAGPRRHNCHIHLARNRSRRNLRPVRTLFFRALCCHAQYLPNRTRLWRGRVSTHVASSACCRFAGREVLNLSINSQHGFSQRHGNTEPRHRSSCDSTDNRKLFDQLQPSATIECLPLTNGSLLPRSP
jgi:hypothetical protein